MIGAHFVRLNLLLFDYCGFCKGVNCSLILSTHIARRAHNTCSHGSGDRCSTSVLHLYLGKNTPTIIKISAYLLRKLKVMITCSPKKELGLELKTLDLTHSSPKFSSWRKSKTALLDLLNIFQRNLHQMLYTLRFFYLKGHTNHSERKY